MDAPRHRSIAAPLALAWCAVVVYATLFPFSGWREPPAWQSPWKLAWPRWNDWFDIWANILGYLPTGALILVALRRGGLRPWGALALALLLPSALSYAAEVAQNWLPTRHPSLKDWATNSLGGVVGALAAAAAYVAGWSERWRAWRERWFVPPAGGAFALLALWPIALLSPAPVPLGLGQIVDSLRLLAIEALADVPWADDLWVTLVDAPEPTRLWPPAEGAVTALGLLAPCLVAYTVVRPGWRRLVLVAGALVLTLAVMGLATALNFGPEHAGAWLVPTTLPGLAAGALAAALLAPLRRRLAAVLGLVAITGGVMLVAQAPADPYFGQTLQLWEQGRFIQFNGLAQWIGRLWPYGAAAWLFARVAARAPGADPGEAGPYNPPR